MTTPTECPTCKTNDFIEFVFYCHHERGEKKSENPSDNHWIFLCKDGHFFDNAMEKLPRHILYT